MSDGIAAKSDTATLASEWLPFNRKEQFFTGTVLPMLIATDDFARLPDFLELCRTAVDKAGRVEPLGAMQFFTEYSFRESLLKADKKRFRIKKVAGDTPDLVVVTKGWIYVIEAKMFHRPSALDVHLQMKRQAALADKWRNEQNLKDFELVHVALLPQGLVDSFGSAPIPFDYITWDAIAGRLPAGVASHWQQQLDHALTNWTALAPKPANESNKHGKRTGAQILDSELEVQEWDPVFDEVGPGIRFSHMGCDGGLTGKRMKQYLREGSWDKVNFQVRVRDYDHGNWFPIADFQKAVGKSAQ